MARGQKLFHLGYEELSRTMEKTKEAGAAMRAEPETERIAEERGTITVERPFKGGQTLRFVGWLILGAPCVVGCSNWGGL